MSVGERHIIKLDAAKHYNIDNDKYYITIMITVAQVKKIIEKDNVREYHYKAKGQKAYTFSMKNPEKEMMTLDKFKENIKELYENIMKI